MIVKQIALTSEGLGKIELPDEFQNDKELKAYVVEYITEFLWSSITPLRDRFMYDFTKEITLPQGDEVVKLNIIFPDDLRIKDIDVDLRSLDTRYFDAFLILLSDLTDKLLEEAGIEPLS